MFTGFPFVATEHQQHSSQNQVDLNVQSVVVTGDKGNSPAQETVDHGSTINTETERKLDLSKEPPTDDHTIVDGEGKSAAKETIGQQSSIETQVEKEFGLRHAQLKLKRISSAEIAKWALREKGRNKRKIDANNNTKSPEMPKRSKRLRK